MNVRVTAVGADCWSPLANQRLPEKLSPPCATCGKPALGANFDSCEAGGTIGKPIFIARFDCGAHERKFFALMSAALYPNWKVIYQLAPGVVKVQKLSDAERIARVKAKG